MRVCVRVSVVGVVIVLFFLIIIVVDRGRYLFAYSL